MGAMRLVGLVVLLAAVAPARADKRTQDLVPQLERELAGCGVQAAGLAKVAAGAAGLAKTVEATERDEIEKDAAALASGHALVKGYCDEVAALIAFLKDHAATAYKTVEKELDARDNKLRGLRKEARKQIEELGPVTRKIIPRMARTQPVQTEERRLPPAKFPSRRTVELPALDGSWKLTGTSVTDTAEYADKTATASVTTRPFTGATCDQQRKALATRSDADEMTELELGAAKDVGVVWSVRYTRRDKRLIHLMCVPTKTGGLLGTATVAPADQLKLADEMAKVLVRMLAVQLDVPAPKL
jgi:hypothetical protein